MVLQPETSARGLPPNTSMIVSSAKKSAKVLPPRTSAMILPSRTSSISFRDLNIDTISHITNFSLLDLYNSKYELVEYKLVDGIPEDKLNINLLFRNKNALYYLDKLGVDIDWEELSNNTNPVAIEVLKEEIKLYKEEIKKATRQTKVQPLRINWKDLSANPSAGIILKENLTKINWKSLVTNTSSDAIALIRLKIENAEKYKKSADIDWKIFSANESPEAISLLRSEILKRPENIYNIEISKNYGAIELLKEHPYKISGESLCANRADGAIELLKTHLKLKPYDINWYALSSNPSDSVFDFLQLEENKSKARDKGVDNG
jgi:hypothetical protein